MKPSNLNLGEGTWLCEIAIWTQWWHRGQLSAQGAALYTYADVGKFVRLVIETGGFCYLYLRTVGILMAAVMENMMSEDNENDLSIDEAKPPRGNVTFKLEFSALHQARQVAVCDRALHFQQFARVSLARAMRVREDNETDVSLKDLLDANVTSWPASAAVMYNQLGLDLENAWATYRSQCLALRAICRLVSTDDGSPYFFTISRPGFGLACFITVATVQPAHANAARFTELQMKDPWAEYGPSEIEQLREDHAARIQEMRERAQHREEEFREEIAAAYSRESEADRAREAAEAQLRRCKEELAAARLELTRQRNDDAPKAAVEAKTDCIRRSLVASGGLRKALDATDAEGRVSRCLELAKANKAP
ncbi:CngA [Symbiodinium pilosum]|uniref:CngA protein n=1 Tax=Symbiodinium pilosum TaxID=2952 RepID=A0A812QH58_SYMPI|nr:CngA [Symbiodinium pilosum]